eukprot:1487973-Prymnesium_polylepis.1
MLQASFIHALIDSPPSFMLPAKYGVHFCQSAGEDCPVGHMRISLHRGSAHHAASRPAPQSQWTRL